MTGVNLGGWLVPERWMTPSLFSGGAPTPRALRQHFATFITPDDIAWLALHGVQAVRIPVPYKVPFDYVDPIVAAAGWHGIHVLIDVHTAPGSQNGWDHSGRAGEPRWHTDPHNITETLDAVGVIASHYAHTPNVWGIGVLNEPHWSIPHSTLADYYRRAYHKIRQHSATMQVVCSDAFRPHDWQGEFPQDTFQNIALDMHLYQCFTPEDKALSLGGHVQKARIEWAQLIAHVQQEMPVVVGEWSLGFDEPGEQAAKQYARAQQEGFAQAAAQFYWSYKTEAANNWNFRHCVQAGLLRL